MQATHSHFYQLRANIAKGHARASGAAQRTRSQEKHQKQAQAPVGVKKKKKRLNPKRFEQQKKYAKADLQALRDQAASESECLKSKGSDYAPQSVLSGPSGNAALETTSVLHHTGPPSIDDHHCTAAGYPESRVDNKATLSGDGNRNSNLDTGRSIANALPPFWQEAHDELMKLVNAGVHVENASCGTVTGVMGSGIECRAVIYGHITRPIRLNGVAILSASRLGEPEWTPCSLTIKPYCVPIWQSGIPTVAQLGAIFTNEFGQLSQINMPPWFEPVQFTSSTAFPRSLLRCSSPAYASSNHESHTNIPQQPHAGAVLHPANQCASQSLTRDEFGSAQPETDTLTSKSGQAINTAAQTENDSSLMPPPDTSDESGNSHNGSDTTDGDAANTGEDPLTVIKHFLAITSEAEIAGETSKVESLLMQVYDLEFKFMEVNGADSGLLTDWFGSLNALGEPRVRWQKILHANLGMGDNAGDDSEDDEDDDGSEAGEGSGSDGEDDTDEGDEHDEDEGSNDDGGDDEGDDGDPESDRMKSTLTEQTRHGMCACWVITSDRSRRKTHDHGVFCR